MKMEISLGSATGKTLLVFVVSSTLALLVIVLSGGYWSTSVNPLLDQQTTKLGAYHSDPIDDFQATSNPTVDKFLGGLLTTAFDEASCLSRYQSASYWKELNITHSSYLLERLRKYEALHKRCGPNTELYNKSVEHLISNKSTTEPSECRYVVWIAEGGLGNRIIALVSSFLYALLNDKVLLLSMPDDLHDIFCEPFPETSWILPSDFPIPHFFTFNVESPKSFGNMLKNKVIALNEGTSNAAVSTPLIYLHLEHDYKDMDKMFFRDDAQALLKNVQWLLLRSNLYFAPGLFLLPQYDDELNKLFPEKDTVFNFLARYLIHPSNSVWGYITRFYGAYLANAKERIGIQIRIFPQTPTPIEIMFPHVMNCTKKEAMLLPEVALNGSISSNTLPAGKPIAVLVASMKGDYYEKLKSIYYEHPAAGDGRELIGVYQTSHEEKQRTKERAHNAKALADMYLLSFSDEMMTTGWSTFGYVGAGLGGLRPWVLLGRERGKPPCRRVGSMEPCFLMPPYSSFAIKEHSKVEPGGVATHIGPCEDHFWGLKLFN